MAKKTKQNAVPAPAKKSSAGGNMWVAIIIFLALSTVILPTMLIILVGMMPTFVAYFIDRAKSGMSWICVGGMNGIATMSYLLDLWFGGLGLDFAMETIFSVFPWIAMYGMAGFGWMLYLSMPAVVGIFLSLAATTRAASLKSTQRRLIELWGAEVTGETDKPSMDDELEEI